MLPRIFCLCPQSIPFVSFIRPCASTRFWERSEPRFWNPGLPTAWPSAQAHFICGILRTAPWPMNRTKEADCCALNFPGIIKRQKENKLPWSVPTSWIMACFVWSMPLPRPGITHDKCGPFAACGPPSAGWGPAHSVAACTQLNLNWGASGNAAGAHDIRSGVHSPASKFFAPLGQKTFQICRRQS